MPSIPIRPQVNGGTIPTSTSSSSSTSSTPSTLTQPTTAPRAEEASTSTTTDGVERGPRRAFNPVLSLLNRFGTVAPMSDEQREKDLAYRAGRAAALEKAMPGMVQSKAPFHTLIQEAHRTLNVDKKFSTIVRLSSLFLRNNLENEGQFRTGPNRAGPFVAPASKDVEPLMSAFGTTMGHLVDDAKASNDDTKARLAAAWALTVMIRIHPFMDGNGRSARATMNLTLAKAGQGTIDFPSDSEGVYKKSIVWQGLKDHMRGFIGPTGVGWSMNDGVVPPNGYFEKLADLLQTEISTTTTASLAARPDIVKIADALGHVRQHGFV